MNKSDEDFREFNFDYPDFWKLGGFSANFPGNSTINR